MKITRWSILAAEYVAWNFVAYNCEKLFDNPIWFDFSYYLGERCFVVLTFWALVPYVEKSYKWIVKSLALVAIWKLIYLTAVIAGLITANQGANIMGLLFTAIVATIIFRWPKHSR